MATDETGRAGGRSVLVVGGTGGLGTSMVHAMLARGHRVAITTHAASGLAEVQDLIDAGRIQAIVADIRVRSELEAGASELKEAGFAPDSIIANAGTVARDLALDVPDADIRRVLKPGGWLQFADIANGRPVPPEALRDIDLWTG